MKSKEIQMTIEEFNLMERPFGWKTEYWDGKAHLRPIEHIIATKLEVTQRESTQNFELTKIKESYKPQMIRAFFESFRDSVEFCNWRKTQIYKHAENNINGYFVGERGKPFSNSIMVLDSDNNVSGLALFVYDKKNNIRLDLLFVRPSYQGKKMATQMVSDVVNHLYKEDIKELFSDYHICNEVSRNWHSSFGFKELYDQYYIRLRYYWLRSEIWRREKLGLSDRLEDLVKEKDWWYSQLENCWKH